MTTTNRAASFETAPHLVLAPAPRAAAVGKTLLVHVLVAAVLGASVAPAYAQAPAQPAPAPAAKPAAPAQAAAPAAKPAAPAPAAAGAAKPAAAKPAPAKDPKPLLASAEKKLKAGDHAGALADAKAADEAKPSPEAARLVAAAEDNLGHYPEAVAAYERFLADVPAKLKAEGEDAKKRVEAIKALPGKVKLESVPSGASVVVDDKPHDKPTPTELELAPGKHTIKVSADGKEPEARELDIAFASTQELKLELKDAPTPPPAPVPVAAPPPKAAEPPPPPPEPRSKIPAYVTGGVALVAAGFGTYFGIRALSQSSDFDKTPTVELADDGENNALLADMMFGVAITFGVTSAVLFLSDDGPEKTAKAKARPVAKAAPKAAKPKILPTPYVTPTGGGGGFVVRF